MTKYQEFLEGIGIISEERFNKVIESLPGLDIRSIYFRNYPIIKDEDVLVCILLDNIFDEVSISSADFENKEIEIEYAYSIQELDFVKNKLPKWTIINYDDIKEDLLEEEEKESLLEEVQSKIKYSDKETLEKILKVMNND